MSSGNALAEHDRHHLGAGVLRYFEQLSWQDFREKHVSVRDFSLLQQILESDIVRFVLSQPGQRIVDIGAGFCDLEDWLATNHRIDETCTLLAVDISFNMLRQRPAKLYPFPVHPVVSNVELCALADASVDTAFAINVTPYLGSLEAFISQMARILREGGYLILFDPEDCALFWQTSFEGMTVQLGRPGILISLFRSAGFEVQEGKEILIHPMVEVPSIELRIGNCMTFRKSRQNDPTPLDSGESCRTG